MKFHQKIIVLHRFSKEGCFYDDFKDVNNQP